MKSFGKKLLIIMMVISCLMLTGCEEKKTGLLTEITANECFEKMEAQETFIVFIGQLSCPHCADYFENLEKYMESHPLYMYVVEADAEVNKDGSFKKLYTTYFPDLEYTPTTYYVVDGVVVDEVINVMDSTQITSWLKKNNIVLE